MADPAVAKTHLCINCKLLCDSSSICCSQCYNWFHTHCSGLKKSEVAQIRSSNQTFKCLLCTSKLNCHLCSRKFNPRSLRINCINCEHSFCSKCAALSGNSVRFYLSPNQDFYCKDCDDTYACLKCEKPCETSPDSDPSILCNSCNKWIHFGCSRLNARQFNKLGRSNEPYFCLQCASQAPYPFQIFLIKHF